MRVYLDENGYVYLHANDSDYCEGDFETVSDDFLTEHFLTHRKCYRYKDGKLEYDESHEQSVIEEEKKNHIRLLREQECFPFINRGWLWYQELSASNLLELTKWYKAWLDATETYIIPDKPKWLK